MCGTHVPTICLSVPLLVLFSAMIGVAQDDDEREPPKLLGPVPRIKIDPATNNVTKEEKERISAHIDQLAEIKDPDYGFAPLMGGIQFAPIKDSATFGVGIIMINHGLKTNEALERLVALGPKALPQLLERLSDKTPTKLVMEHGGGFGGQWYGHEVPLNLANPAEQQVQAKHRKFLQEDGALSDQNSHIQKHEVTIGDVCFVIIGQIVNRGYQSARYQPTACRVINSPTHDAELAEVVRDIWKSDQPAQKLLNSLLLDFFTRDDGTDVQCGAAMRLLYYFPDETEELIAQRISGFEFGTAADENDWDGFQDKYGVDVNEFLKAVRTSSRAVITDALLHVAKQTKNPEIFHEAISEAVVKQAPDMVFERMKQIVAVAPPADQGPFGGEYETLMDAARFFPDKSEELFETYRRHNTLETLRAAIDALSEPRAPRDWMIRFLAALLDDKRDTGWEYGPNFDRQPIRICDEAAKVLADGYLKCVRFEYEKDPAHLDRQIKKIKRVLAGEKDVSFDLPEQFVLPPDLPQRDAQRVVAIDDKVGHVYAFSTEDVLWASHGSRSDKGWARETWKIDAKTGKITDRIFIDVWKGGVSSLRNGPANRIFAYHGYEGGDVLVRDAKTGRLLNKVPTPFHDGIEFNDPLQVRNLSDVTLCGVKAEWIVAVTPDGALHSINVETGRHRIEWREKSDHPELIGVRGTSQVLLEGVGGKGLFDVPIKIWDQSTQKLETIEKVPYGGWRGTWGDLAWNNMNGHATLWNLGKRRELKLPTSDVPVQELDSNQDQSRIFVLRHDGTVEVFSVIDGISLKPILRLKLPVKEKMDVSIVVANEGEQLFWLGRQPYQTDDEGRPIDVPDRTVMAVFDYGSVNE